MNEPLPSEVLFAATLAPYRSLPPKGFIWMIAALGGLGFCANLGFVLAGAWPIAPFFGLDLALLYFAFRLSSRRARQSETVRLTQEALDVERVGTRGERRRWRFEPFWLRVVCEESANGQNRLLLASHGKFLPLGSFLSPQERRRFAAALNAALQRWRDGLRAGPGGGAAGSLP